MTSFITGPLRATGLIDEAFQTSLTSAAGVMLFDAVPRETHRGQSQLTDHPVEDGVVVSDHTIDQPDELELTAIVSNRPILLFARARAEPSVPGGDPQTRAEDAYAEIVRLRKTASLVDVSTRLRDYAAMQIVSETVTRDKDTSEIIEISIRIREFRVATVEAVGVPEATEPEDSVHKKKQNQGRKQKAPAPPVVEEKMRSLAVGGIEFVRGLF